MIQVTRTAHCVHCAEAHRPTKGDWYLLLGGSHPDQFMVEICDRSISALNKGFTPHLYSLIKSKDSKIFATSLCLIHNCGVIVQPKKTKGEFDIYVREDRVQSHVFTIPEWNSIIFYTDKEYWL